MSDPEVTKTPIEDFSITNPTLIGKKFHDLEIQVMDLFQRYAELLDWIIALENKIRNMEKSE